MGNKASTDERRSDVHSDEPLLNHDSPREEPQRDRTKIPYRMTNGVVVYRFTGKLTLFPLTILLFAGCAGVLLLYGKLPYTAGYFTSNEVYYGVVGLFLGAWSVIFAVTLARWIVLKISFTFSPRVLRITKHGIFRRSVLEFSLYHSTLHYYRTHFSEDYAWIQLVVKEGTTYYQIYSWKGKGNQKDYFLQLFASLTNELINHQKRYCQRSLQQENRGMSEIVSKQELILISPFTARLRFFSEMDTSRNTVMGRRTLFSAASARCSTMCIEDLPLVTFDSFFNHFKHQKEPLPYDPATAAPLSYGAIDQGEGGASSTVFSKTPEGLKSRKQQDQQPVATRGPLVDTTPIESGKL